MQKEDLRLLVTLVGLVSAAGIVAPPFFIIANDCMEDDEYFLQEVEGLYSSRSHTSVNGYICNDILSSLTQFQKRWIPRLCFMMT